MTLHFLLHCTTVTAAIKRLFVGKAWTTTHRAEMVVVAVLVVLVDKRRTKVLWNKILLDETR